MTQYNTADTIVATASPTGTGAVALLRLSGSASWDIARSLLRKPLRNVRPRRSYVRDLVLTSGIRERAVLTFWEAPNSYTGENMVELSIHGNPILVAQVVAECIALGARPAEAGEFTFRAYLHGKLDLAQAEAVQELITAGSSRALNIASAALAGTPSQRVRGWVGELTALIAAIEVIHDYASDDLDASLDPGMLLTHDKLREQLAALLQQMRGALEASRRSLPLRTGMTLAICGPPNVGKSTLFNALLGYERSLVSPQPGTTRDYITESLEASGVRLTLVDTAGQREAGEEIEAAGVQRAADWASSADRVLWVSAADAAHADLPAGGTSALRVITRCDLMDAWPAAQPGVLCVSGRSGRGIDLLWQAIAAMPMQLEEFALESYSARQATCIAAGVDAIEMALAAAAEEQPFDIVAAELYRSIAALMAVYEQTDHAAVINTIFSTFCVGK